MAGSNREQKGNGLTSLVKEISRQHSIQAIAWLLLTSFIQNSSKREEKHENVKWRICVSKLEGDDIVNSIGGRLWKVICKCS